MSGVRGGVGVAFSPFTHVSPHPSSSHPELSLYSLEITNNLAHNYNSALEEAEKLNIFSPFQIHFNEEYARKSEI